MDGGEEHIVAWQGELAPNQTALVPLPALAATIGTHSLTVWTQIPNDEYAANDAITMDFEVVPGNVVTMAIQFDFLPYGVTWAVESPSDEDPILSGGNYVNADFASQYISIQGCATPGCYTLTVEDLFGNGMHYSPPGWSGQGDAPVAYDNIFILLPATPLGNTAGAVHFLSLRKAGATAP